MDNLDEINKRITDRSNVFYWQTDRRISVEEAGKIWADRTKGLDDDSIIENVNRELKEDKLVSLDKLLPDSQTRLGNVSHVRVGRLASGKEVVIRNFPIGVLNGYFNCEALASTMALKAKLPAYHTYAIHYLNSSTDFSFHVLDKLPGSAILKWLEKHPNDETKITFEVGKLLAKVNQIPVTGFGSFDNELAKKGKLIGLHRSFASALQANIDANLSTLEEYKILTTAQSAKSRKLFVESNHLTNCEQPVLVHNDFADWNLLTDGKAVTGILDWDECVGGDFVSDIACWSTFYDPKRLDTMLKGYWSIREKPEDFEDRFQLIRFRYAISKMALRQRRYNWEKSEFLINLIDKSKKHIEAAVEYFGID